MTYQPGIFRGKNKFFQTGLGSKSINRSHVYGIIKLNLLMKFDFHDFRQWYLTVAERYREIE